MEIRARLADPHQRRIYPATIRVEGSRIADIAPADRDEGPYVLPGFIDAHVHVESSMLVPSEFARLAVAHGTVATVSDPHEIANVLGVEGVEYMIDSGRQVPFKFYFGAPSCVPATPFETAGAVIGLEGVRQLLAKPEVKYLAEMMNYPGVLQQDRMVLDKIAAARAAGKPVDGHAPGLRGEDAQRYIEAGITTDHECFTYEEALEKLQYGMKILIREGSAAKNFEALIELLPLYPDQIMFCSDDKHPDDLIAGHINQLVSRGLQRGYDLFDLIRAASIHPAEHYGLETGQLRVGDPADFVLVDELETMKVRATYIDGQLVARDGVTQIASRQAAPVNNFRTEWKTPEAFRLKADKEQVRVIQAINGEIVTFGFTTNTPSRNGEAVSDTERDLLKIAVVNRYANQQPALGFIQNFQLRKGAIASCVAHDSHNIIAVGVTDEDICRAVNAIIDKQGGIAASSDGQTQVLPLPVAGIMTNEDGYRVAEKYKQLDRLVKEELGSGLSARFMTLSFMALLVIPDLKLSDKGLFDGKSFQFTDLFVREA